MIERKELRLVLSRILWTRLDRAKMAQIELTAQGGHFPSQPWTMRPSELAYVEGLPPSVGVTHAKAGLMTLARHAEDPDTGRCVICVERCGCMDLAGDTYEEWGKAWSNCTHGNAVWPCFEICTLAAGEGLDFEGAILVLEVEAGASPEAST